MASEAPSSVPRNGGLHHGPGGSPPHGHVLILDDVAIQQISENGGSQEASTLATPKRHSRRASTHGDCHSGVNGGQPAGRLRFRCVGAEGLPAADAASSIFSKATSDPYAELTLLVNGQPHHKVHRTHTIQKTLTPTWRQEFFFDVRGELRTLTLGVEIYDEDEGEIKSDFLGKTKIHLDKASLMEIVGHWKPIWRQLESDKDKGGEAQGKVQIMVRWEPAGLLSCWALLTQIAHSPKACVVLGALQVGFAGVLMLVSYTARWICHGRHFADCKTFDVPGVYACTLVGAAGAFASALIRFMGAAGVFGRAWSEDAGGLMEDVGMEELYDEASDDEDVDPAIEIDIDTITMMSNWKIRINTNLLPMLPVKATRITALVAHLLAFSLAGLAMALTYLEVGPSEFLAEGAWLNGTAMICLLGGAITIFYANRVAAKMSSELWHRRPIGGGTDAQKAILGNAGKPARSHGRMSTVEEAAQGAATVGQGLTKAFSTFMHETTDKVAELSKPLLGAVHLDNLAQNSDGSELSSPDRLRTAVGRHDRPSLRENQAGGQLGDGDLERGSPGTGNSLWSCCSAPGSKTQ